MNTNLDAQAHTMTDAAFQAACPMVPVGCISSIPRQSIDSCYLVIQTLAEELSWMTFMLGEAIAIAYDGDESDESEAERQERPIFQALNSAESLLEDLRRDWPHLNL
jgi:hypothetical protein